MKAAAGIATGPEWGPALASALGEVAEPLQGQPVDLALLFASPEYSPYYAEMLAQTRKTLGARVLIGCSGQGIIGRDSEIEQEPAISVLAFSLPGVELSALRIKQADLEDGDWLHAARLVTTGVNAWLLLTDPFSLDAERLLSALGEAYPNVPLIGGLASGDMRRQETRLFLDDEVVREGAVALAIGGPYSVQTVVSQGAEPIGDTWTITAARGNMVESLGMRPALEILSETFRALPAETQERARSNLLVGLAMNEYQDEFQRGDFLIRNLLGIDQARGAIAIGATPRVGQTLQFQLRDPAAADSDLVELLGRARAEFGENAPAGALLCACNGRGIGLFGTPGHDVGRIRELLGPLPVAGFFCNGEIGPVGGKPFLHGFTASIALIVKSAHSA